MNGIEERTSRAGMGLGAKIGVIAVLIAMVAAALYARNHRSGDNANAPQVNQSAIAAPVPVAPAESPKVALPRLVDLGAGKCIPCRMMAPILEELKQEYAGKLEVVFIDVWQNRQAGEDYGVNVIPTQIFFDASGKELFRHEGFFAKDDILGKWQELGLPLSHDVVTTTGTPR